MGRAPKEREVTAVTDTDDGDRRSGAVPSDVVDGSTMSGLELAAVYGPPDGEFPGQWPYTRGPYTSMYRGKLWTMRMFAGFGTAADTNTRFKDLLGAGGTGLS